MPENVTIGLIEHAAEDCPAEYKHRADEVVPAIREAAAEGTFPEAIVFSAHDHGGPFAEVGTPEEVEARLPEIPHHQVTLKDATDDSVAQEHVANTSWLGDERARRSFVSHVETKYFPGRFPKKDGPIVAGSDLADFIEAKHT